MTPASGLTCSSSLSVSTDRPTQEAHNTGISDPTQPLRQSQEKYSFLKTTGFGFLIPAANTVGRGCALGFQPIAPDRSYQGPASGPLLKPPS